MLVLESDNETEVPSTNRVKSVARTIVVTAVAILVGVLSQAQIAQTLNISEGYYIQRLLAYTDSFRIANTYGLFAVMTKDRPEIIVEGSQDGITWLPYVFKFKPGPLDRPPPIIAPLQPRLDWQMWFAALAPVRDSPWFIKFIFRLLQPSPDVVQLLAFDPFHGTAPKFIRAQSYQYKFTTFSEWQRTHNWWKREPAGDFLPPVSLEDFHVRTSEVP